MGLTQREFIDKKIFFRKSDVTELEEGESDDIYIQSSHCPDSLYPMDQKKYVRCYSYYCMQRIGKMDCGGSYLHVVDQSDLKINTWLMQRLLPLLVPSL